MATLQTIFLCEVVMTEAAKVRNKFFKTFVSIVIVIAILATAAWFFYFRHYRYTDDAYVQGNLVALTPLKDGFVKGIYSDDTYLATKDQLLVELDETDSLIAISQAQDNLGKIVRQVCQIYHDVFAFESEINIQKAQLIVAYQDWEHRIGVIDNGGVSLEDFEHSESALMAQYYSLQKTESLYLKQRAMIQADSIHSNPLVQAAMSELLDAWVQLYRCKIYAPVEGLVAQRKIQVGMHVKSGEPLLSIIPLDQIWVNANYKETQMKNMRIGQSVKITSDLYGSGVVYHGHIAGLPGGAGNAFSLLPPQNLSGNWIKIVQRLPVRVALKPEEIKAHPLRVGLSMHAKTKVYHPSGLLVPESNSGSPEYTTPIYREETVGSEKFVHEIVMKNLDPLLIYYLDTPFEVEDEPQLLLNFDNIHDWMRTHSNDIESNS